MNRRDVINKVRKLLALGDKARNSSEAEANAALMKAMELIERHDLDADEYGESHAELVEYNRDDYGVSILTAARSTPFWRRRLVQAAAMATGCKAIQSYWPLGAHVRDAIDADDKETHDLLREWTSEAAGAPVNYPCTRGKVMVVTGRPEDRAVCRAIFSYLEDTCLRLAREHVRKVSARKKRDMEERGWSRLSPRTEGNGYRSSYAEGVLNQVLDKKRQQRGERKGHGLIVLDREQDNLRQAFDAIFDPRSLVNVRGGSYSHNQSAYSQGSKAYLGRNTMGGNRGGAAGYLDG